MLTVSANNSNNELNDLSPKENKDDPGTLSGRLSGSLDSLIDLYEGVDDEDLKGEIERKKKYKRGVVYLSFIPPSMTPTILRHLLSEYGPIERIFLQPEFKKKGKKYNKQQMMGRKNIKYCEGWVEFLKKRDAKKIAEVLNNMQIGGKRRSKFHDYLWNLKYLPRFKWVHLCERLSYEKAVRQQKLRAEISQAKRVANYFADSVDKEERLKRMKRQLPERPSLPPEIVANRLKQREAIHEKKYRNKSTLDRDEFLKNLFS